MDKVVAKQQIEVAASKTHEEQVGERKGEGGRVRAGGR
jgi:hypothetical protein